ncbi:hypothetical protein LTR99_009302 [Exophiala xenobiotica]|uniref:Uncharacterized protein n=1 Tax=Vermiconidia calcicola TaxID=1690605 RepID=A0AAV9PXK3_9PEZI|nr:hypothetical protein LTR41_003891 [Exophiala xenobiotica]KAK5531025.1 hypothetical protein LTR25_008882 [Vermiconidia calcicola]KAK5536276.1 hypothetical protein LTR23_007994 [Chaetothyriales sp. CCFEE 6169]KAK5238370.1 hypothetical protein LTR47_000113 [Exophiala xenobiotica]KAK5252651.1 hypothetical protein LTS06_002828 [Exophiala xenobiotica]
MTTETDTKSLSSRKSEVFRHVAAHRKLERLQRAWKLRASALDLYQTLQLPPKRQSQELDKSFVGSIDPFDSLPLPATTEVYHLLQFDQLYISPALDHSKIPRQPSSTYLHDELSAYGFLARIAAIKARCADFGAFHQALKLKAEAMRRLREILPHMNDITRLSRAVMSLMYAESWCDNYQAADVHLQLLGVMNNRHGLETTDLICILHQDIQRATLTLARTHFSMQDKIWNALEGDFIHSFAAGGDLEAGPQGPFGWILREMTTAFTALDVLQRSDAPRNIRNAAAIKCLHIMGSIVNHYHSTSDTVEKYTALAVLYRIRRAADMERIPLCARDIYDSGRAILPRLRELLIATSHDEPAMRLWVLSVGSMAGDSWFKQEFSHLAKTLGLHDPAAVSGLLSDFEFSTRAGLNLEVG